MTIPFAKQTFPEMYEQNLVGPLFRLWVEPTLDAVGLGPGERVLDVACGTGVVARLARERVGSRGKVVGIDLSPAMLAVARAVGPGVDWREGDVAALPLEDGERFDVVICQQGLQFFSDRLAALREMHRALGAGGRVAVSTWRPDEEIPLCIDLRRVAERHVGPIVDRRHTLGESGPLEALLEEAGFRDVRSTILSRTTRFPDGSVFARMNAMALVGMSEAGPTISEEERGRLVTNIVRDCADVMRRYSDDSGLAFELRTNLVTAYRQK
jgi:ubiquinone/menaquinone biosynthesis C-methylase UbiE